MAGCLPDLSESHIGRAIAADSCPHLLWCLNHKENLYHRDKRKNTYLHYACTLYRPKILYLLLTTDLNIDEQNKSGNTPLHITAICNQSCLVPILMMYGANPYLINNMGQLPSDIKTNNVTWKAGFRIYEPGVFVCVERNDANKLLELMRKWCKTDVHKNERSLRQLAAYRGHHDIVALIDKYRFTLECIHGVLEQNYDKFEKGATKSSCDVNWLNEGAGHRHIIQYAIEWNLEKMVALLCERGADVNLIINYKQYIKAPLYFTVLANQAISVRMMTRVINSGADINAKDERGRNAVMFTLDRPHTGRLSLIVDHFLKRGLDIAARDDTGATVRNIALLNNNTEIVTILDKMMIKLIRASSVGSLWRLAEDGYDGFCFQYLWKDSFIYAAGNDTDDVTVFLTSLSQFYSDAKQLHAMLTTTGNEEKIRHFLDCSEHKQHLLVAKDRAGRTPLTMAVMLGDTGMVEYLLTHDVCTRGINLRKDNLYRSSLHYAYSLVGRNSEPEVVIKSLLAAGASADVVDVFGRRPSYYSAGKAKKQLIAEITRSYGLDLEMHLMKKYKEMYKIITSKSKSTDVKYKRFLKSARNFCYPMCVMANTLRPHGIPLMTSFRDLLYTAIDHKQVDIAKKLVYLGSDCQRQELVTMDGAECVHTAMSPAHYADHKGLGDLAKYIDSHQQLYSRRSMPFHRSITE